MTAAGDLESQTLEFKSWCKDDRELSQQIAEAAVCLANSEGGFVIVGVDDRKVGRAAAPVCPHGSISADWAKAKIRELTKPPARCTIAAVRDLPIDPPLRDHQGLLVIEVLKTNQPSGHRTSRGVSFVRSYKECRPEYFEDQDDYSRALVDHLSYSHLDESAIKEAATHRELAFSSVRMLGYRPSDHLIETELLVPKTERGDSQDSDRVLTVAAILLFGKEKVIKAEFPAAETVLALETSINTPLTASKWLNVIDSIRSYLMWIKENLPKTELKVPDDVIRELLFNAYLHRSYRTQAAVQIRIDRDELEIQNPGGLLGGLTAENLLYSPPIYRNFLLADAARQYGYCEKAGRGIDKIYFNLIVSGFDFPIFDGSHDSFSVIVRLRRDKAFAGFIKDFAGSLELKLTDLIVLRALRARSQVPKDDLTRLAQRPPNYMEDVLYGLERRQIIRRVRDGYGLSETTVEQLTRYSEDGQLKLFQN